MTDDPGITEDHKTYQRGADECDKEARPPGSHPERGEGREASVSGELSMESEQLTSHDVTHCWADHEPGLEHANVERRVLRGDHLVQEGQAQSYGGGSSESMKELPEYKHVTRVEVTKIKTGVER